MAPAVNSKRTHLVPGCGDGFDIKAVEQALALLWRAEPAAEQAHTDTIRACSVNFIIPIAPGGYDRWQVRLSELARQVPSRIIVLEMVPEDSTPPIDAYVTATCHRRKSGTLICSEMIHIRAIASSCLFLPSICRALAVSDLPLFHVSVETSGMDDKAARELFDLADLSIIDSAHVPVRECEGDPATCDGDLAWPRLLPWRSAVGHFISTCQVLDPARIRRVRIEGARHAAWLLAGWLSYLLRWKIFRTEVQPPSVVVSDGRAVLFEFSQTESGVCGIELLRLELNGVSGDFVEIVAVSDRELSISASLRGDHFSVQSLAKTPGFAEEVAAIVHSHGADDVYARARAFALVVKEQSGS